MSIVPAIDIGVWNAWILMVWLLIPYFLEPLNIIPKGREEGDSFVNEFNRMQKSAFFTMQILYILLIIYSVFVPLELGTVWFYAGLPIYLIGLISYSMVFAGFVNVPIDKLVTRGIYRYSRNPMQLSMFVLLVGTGIATASWIFLLLSVLFMVIPLLWLTVEESHLLKIYGDAYLEYKNKTPRWIGIPKARKE